MIHTTARDGDTSSDTHWTRMFFGKEVNTLVKHTTLAGIMGGASLLFIFVPSTFASSSSYGYKKHTVAEKNYSKTHNTVSSWVNTGWNRYTGNHTWNDHKDNSRKYHISFRDKKDTHKMKKDNNTSYKARYDDSHKMKKDYGKSHKSHYDDSHEMKKSYDMSHKTDMWSNLYKYLLSYGGMKCGDLSWGWSDCSEQADGTWNQYGKSGHISTGDALSTISIGNTSGVNFSQ